MAVSIYSILLRAFLVRGKVRAFNAIPSEQLRAGLVTIETAERTGKLHVPHYWALYYHDGRGPSRGNPLLIWFKNPKDDPRYPGGRYPVRRSEVKHLTPVQMNFWRRKNQVIINNYKRSTGRRVLTSSDYRAMDLPMIIARVSPEGGGSVGPVSAFFSNELGGGMSGFKKEANEIGSKIASKYVTTNLKTKGLLKKKISITLRI